MSEKQSRSNQYENHREAEQLREEHDKHAERLREQLENAERAHEDKRSSEHDALLEAKHLAEKQSDSHHDRTPSPAERRRGPLSKKQLDSSFSEQMKHVRTHLGPGSRAFSRLVHKKPVEKASDFIGSTIARPNALLAGSITAFLSVTILYLTANHFGFQLSGFEAIGAFAIGWILGLIYDYASVAFRSKND